MSKASVYADYIRDNKAVWKSHLVCNGYSLYMLPPSAEVTSYGRCRINMNSYDGLDAEDAVSLAKWILETFGP